MVAVRLNLLDLATASDTAGGNSGTAFDNVTSAHDLSISALLEPNQPALLFDGLVQVGSATADAGGKVNWSLTGVATGTHDYTVVNPTEMVPYRLDNDISASHLKVVVI